MTKPLFGSIAPEVMSLLGRRDLQPTVEPCTQPRPTEDDDAAWVDEHGDTCALCGVDRIYTNLIYGRATNRGCLSCF
ncbi:amidoxime-reducing component 1 [Fusarium oxysporum f. sp. albedinis]|nr:amidoxime-reducing component 1 [Fusarium oxysporum f. sp. albedinis]